MRLGFGGYQKPRAWPEALPDAVKEPRGLGLGTSKPAMIIGRQCVVLRPCLILPYFPSIFHKAYFDLLRRNTGC